MSVLRTKIDGLELELSRKEELYQQTLRKCERLRGRALDAERLVPRRSKGKSIKEWQKECGDIEREKGWRDGREKSPQDMAVQVALFHSECSEILEDLRERGLDPCIRFDESDKPFGIPSEMADVVIRIMSCCDFYGIDLESAVAKKVSYNRTRPHRHGGKTL